MILESDRSDYKKECKLTCELSPLELSLLSPPMRIIYLR
jgi:hypothetical protein